MALSRELFIEQVRRQIYGSFPSDDAEITVNLVNQYLDQAIAYAARLNYEDNARLDGIAYVNNSFYTRFTNLDITKDSFGLYKVTLPSVPIGIGATDGISSANVKDSQSNLSRPIVMLSQNQKGLYQAVRNIPNKVLGYTEGEYLFILTTFSITSFTADVTMVSGGVSSDLDSTINVPLDYIPAISDYLKKELNFERNQPVDDNNDGTDQIRTV